MAGKSRLRSTLLCIGLMAICMTGCSVDLENIGTSKEVKTDDISETMDTSEKEKTDEMDIAVDTERDEEPVAEEITPEKRSLSIFGDSISTYEGYIPEGFSVFYPVVGEVTDVSETWWMKLLEDADMELCANDSSSGSTCVGDSLSVDNPKYGCSELRVSSLTGMQGKMPDVIIIYMGTNDLMTSVPLGDNDGTGLVEEGMIENFSDAYCLILDKIASNYPAARIYCCTLLQMGDWAVEQPSAVFTNDFGLTSEDYSNRIRTIAGNKGIPVIDLYYCGIEIDNLREMTSDSVHLTPVGMEYVERAVLDGINDME